MRALTAISWAEDGRRFWFGGLKSSRDIPAGRRNVGRRLRMIQFREQRRMMDALVWAAKMRRVRVLEACCSSVRYPIPRISVMRRIAIVICSLTPSEEKSICGSRMKIVEAVWMERPTMKGVVIGKYLNKPSCGVQKTNAMMRRWRLPRT